MAIRYYVRVSSADQKVERQLLTYDLADFIYIDKTTGSSQDRPELQHLLNDIQKDDIVVIKSVDRLSRSTKDLLEITETIKSKGAILKTLDLNIDTSSPVGECVLTILGAIAQMERTTIKERTAEGIAIAKAQGKYRGRRFGAISLRSPEALARFKRLYKAGLSKAELSREFHVTRRTIYKWISVLKDRGFIK